MKIIYLILILLFTSCYKNEKYILTKVELENILEFTKLRIISSHSEIGTDLMNTCEKNFPNLNIDSIYIDKMNQFIGFKYNLESSNFGIAKIIREKENTKVAFYNQMDTSIDVVDKESFMIIYHKSENKIYSLNDLNLKYFELERVIKK